MADTRGSRTSRSRAGWVWVIVGIVAVGLIVWWIAAAVDEDEGAFEDTGEITAIEETEQRGEEAEQEFGQAGDEAQQEGGQIFEDQNGVFEEEAEQAPRSGQVLGEAPGVNEFNQWNQEQEQAQVDQDYVTQGYERLESAVDDVLEQFEQQQPQPGEQIGGGPMPQQLQDQKQTVEQSLNELKQAESDQQSQAFREAANNVAILIASMAEQAGADQLNQPIENLQQSVQQIQPAQPLAQQEQQVRGFFNQAEQVLSQMSQDLQQQGATGGDPVQQQDQQQQQEYEGTTQ